MKRVWILMALSLGLGAAALAVPQQISYQGFLTDTDGAPLDTVVAMTFKLYDAATSGTQLWTETQPSCTVRVGLFNTLLGSVAAIPDDFNRAQVWLGVTVGSNSEMTPRTRLVSVPYSYRVGTVDGATGGNINSQLFIADKANIGWGNANTGLSAFVAGAGNSAEGDYAAVSGGYHNAARGDYSFVGGGGRWVMADSNCAQADWSAVVGGGRNQATAWYAFVGGGFGNTASGRDAVVTGGRLNSARGVGSFVGGGGAWIDAVDSNAALGSYSTVGGGAGDIASGGYSFVGGGMGDIASGDWSTVAGGAYNIASGGASVICGGNRNRARGTFSFVGGGGGETLSDSNAAAGDYSVIAGGSRCSTMGLAAAIGGGFDNRADNDYTAVGGGYGNRAQGLAAAIGGGCINRADNLYTAVGGGVINTASGYASVVSGGMCDTTSGAYACVPGGASNQARGAASFAAGWRAKALHDGCFVWGDLNEADLNTNAANQFRVRASGGTWFFSRADESAGAWLPAGGSAWNAVSDSTKKRNIRPVDTRAILEKVAALPIQQWSYKSQDPSIEHIGPMAQDFWNLFHVGDDSLSISTIDPSGVALAAIQELKARTDEIVSLRERIEQLEKHIQRLSSSQTTTEQASVALTDGKKR